MKKETASAVFFGIFLGVVVAVIMVFKSGQRETSKFKSLTTITNVTPTTILNNSKIQLLELTEPQDGFITNSNTIRIKGRTSKDDLVVIESPIKEMVFKNSSVNFTVDFSLAYGENVIRVYDYPKDQSLRLQEKELRVYYLED